MRHEDGSVVTRTNSETTPGFRAITMFFKSEQANVSDARDAVKKQLLRSLIQQVVDEINSHTLDERDAISKTSTMAVVEEKRI